MDRLRHHPFLGGIDRLSDREFHTYLLERMHVSASFVGWCEIGRNQLRAPAFRLLVEDIIREEQPAGKRSHFHWLKYDLRLIGVPAESVISSTASGTTGAYIHDAAALLFSSASAYGDVGVLTVLRILGEVLVHSEYAAVVARLWNSGFDLSRSKFYFPHHFHDAPQGSHAIAYAAAMHHILDRLDTVQFEAITGLLRNATTLRIGFLDQFL